MTKEDRPISEREAQDNSQLFNLVWSLHKKDGFLSKFKFSFSDWSTFWNLATKYYTEFHIDPHNTKPEGYRHLHLHWLLQHPHIPTLPCDLDVLMEEMSTECNYILSLPMLLQFTNILTYTILTADCKSYVHLWTLKHIQVHCSINVF